jgi:hypothetical protein
MLFFSTLHYVPSVLTPASHTVCQYAPLTQVLCRILRRLVAVTAYVLAAAGGQEQRWSLQQIRIIRISNYKR